MRSLLRRTGANVGIVRVGRFRDGVVENARPIDDGKRVIFDVGLRGKHLERDRQADQDREHQQADDEPLALDEREELSARDGEDAAHAPTPALAGGFISSAVGLAMRTKMSWSDGFLISKC
jgi:hypothetical protein